MKLKPTITIRDLPGKSKALKDHIQRKIDKLDRFYDQIMQCEVTLEQSQKHKHSGKLYNVRINVSVPNDMLTVNRIENEDAHVAIRDAFNAMNRQLKAYARQRRGKVKQHTVPLHGQIARIFPQQQFGFIEANGDEYYFTPNNVTHADFDSLEAGMEVQFIVSDADEGLQANRVCFGKHHPLEEIDDKYGT